MEGERRVDVTAVVLRVTYGEDTGFCVESMGEGWREGPGRLEWYQDARNGCDEESRRHPVSPWKKTPPTYTTVSCT